jgi:hypothetical protein
MSRWISPGVHLEGNEPGCQCGPDCECPCWQMVGLAPEREDRCRECGCDQTEEANDA